MKLTENDKLKELVFDRLKELDMSQADVIKDAEERGIKITPSSLSKYKKGVKNGLTETQLLFICSRLYIPVNINFGELANVDGKLKWRIPKYDHTKMLQLLSKTFPYAKK
nr:hypothetical protein [uncultured Flavobacterium sp.]